MISVTVVFTQTQAGQAPHAAPSAPAVPAPPDPAQLREQIRQSINAARDAARDAAQDQQRVFVGPTGITVRGATPGQPGTIYVGPRAVDNLIPQQAVTMALGFFAMIAFIVVGWPIARAFGRRIDKRSQVASLDSGTMEQLQRIEQAVDAMSIEVERISESQRFMARLQRDASAHALPGTESR